MKVINLHQEEKQLIELAVKNNRQAQQQLYVKFSPKMLSVCRQYVNDIHRAEDVMITAFMKVFTNLNKFEFNGSFEGWIRRIMVNECIDFIRVKKNIFQLQDIDNVILSEAEDSEEMEDFSTDEIQLLIDSLPDGCKTVFNLYAIEGYKHKEIAELLNIKEGTSKSQFANARKLLQAQVLKLKNKQNGTR
jgi:RNA polymerase sigma-70 factor (ECF subfamily)